MAVRYGMALSRLDKQVLRKILSLFVHQTNVRVKDGTFRYSAEDIRRQVGRGGDFDYSFGDAFKLVMVRYGTRKSETDFDRYDTVFYFRVEPENVKDAKKDETFSKVRKETAEKTLQTLEGYLKENSLAIEISAL